MRTKTAWLVLVMLVTLVGAGEVLAQGLGSPPPPPPPPPTRFVDNGDGTITDHLTGLQWEKKSNTCPGVHCVNDPYTWLNAREQFIPAVNDSSPDGVLSTGLGGHRDWRLPTIEELQSILLAPPPCGPTPCIDPIFGPTVAGTYWSSTSRADLPSSAWGVLFSNGFVVSIIKDATLHVRAVRGGP